MTRGISEARNLTKKPLISIIVPVFNEVENIVPLYDRVSAVVAGLERTYDFEFVFTDNCSTDGSFDILESLSKKMHELGPFVFQKYRLPALNFNRLYKIQGRGDCAT